MSKITKKNFNLNRTKWKVETDEVKWEEIEEEDEIKIFPNTSTY